MILFEQFALSTLTLKAKVNKRLELAHYAVDGRLVRFSLFQAEVCDGGVVLEHLAQVLFRNL